MSLFKKITIIVISGILIVMLSFFSQTLSMQHYQKLDFTTGIVTASALNVRQGPSNAYKVITKVYKNEYVRVFARIGNWYVIQTDNDYIGAASVDYIQAVVDTADGTPTTPEPAPSVPDIVDELTADEREVLDLINKEREKAGLKPLEIDKEVLNIARLKAKDMVDNQYFSHTSEVYGSPFDMLKSFSVSYRAAGENIAGNSSNSAAVTAWMNSQGHKDNILNNAYNYTGIGVVKSPTYGKIYVQMFIGK